MSSIETSLALRNVLCDHLVDNIDEYIGYLTNTQSCHSFEYDIACIDFRTEIEELRQEGNWTSQAGDLLPLALSNWSGQPVKIFSSLLTRPITTITPSSLMLMNTKPIFLSYIMSENGSLPEHYDGCMKIGTACSITADEKEKRSLEQNDINHNQESNVSVSAIQQTTNDSIHIPACSHIESDIAFDVKLDGSLLEELFEFSHDISSMQEDVSDLNCSSNQLEHTTPSKQTPKRGRRKGTPLKKKATYMTPPKKKLSRKRKATPEEWEKSKRQRRRLSGMEYTSQRGKVVPAREVKPTDCTRCKYKCNIKVNDEERQDIFKTVWTLNSYQRQKDFIISHVGEKKTKKYIFDESLNEPVPLAKRKRDIHRSYSFEVNGDKKVVCKKFFLNTLHIGESYVNNAMENQRSGVFVGIDKRGRHTPHNKTSDAALKAIRSHIESFPVVDGHYTRKDSNRKYLGAELNISRMYQLYQEKNKDNLPDTQIKETSNGTLTPEKKYIYDKHITKKIRARQEKKADKDHAKENLDTMVATFDLQAVLQIPCSLVSQIYYMRKLNSYNLSIYNLASKHATCYLWSEVDAKRGSCEIGTCLYLQLMSLQRNIKHVILYSDACAGQNRNQFIATCLMHAVTTLPNIETIDHKFLESGHTQMECDSMHSAIEFAKKKDRDLCSTAMVNGYPHGQEEGSIFDSSSYI
ncbi:unnamed protein product [Mytilus coruscus]|uniref:Uncharacterized protein n=1 Tax=Mytilus coruscus TaxID=42192 RepID=A0A6J8BH53_MYTCO|nr:unnamed protein product [Mytilus coruscus]